MKFIILFNILSLTLCTWQTAQSKESQGILSDNSCQIEMQELIGGLMLSRERERSLESGADAFGSGPALSRLLEGYKPLRLCLSLEQKEDFFWTMLWHSDFDGGEMTLFLKTVHNEVGDSFQEKLERYLVAQKKIGRSSARLEKAEAVITQMKMLRDDK